MFPNLKTHNNFIKILPKKMICTAKILCSLKKIITIIIIRGDNNSILQEINLRTVMQVAPHTAIKITRKISTRTTILINSTTTSIKITIKTTLIIIIITLELREIGKISRQLINRTLEINTITTIIISMAIEIPTISRTNFLKESFLLIDSLQTIMAIAIHLIKDSAATITPTASRIQISVSKIKTA